MMRTTLAAVALALVVAPAHATPDDAVALQRKIAVALTKLGDQLEAIPDRGAADATAAARATARDLDGLYDQLARTGVRDAIDDAKQGAAALSDLDAALTGLDQLKHEQDAPAAVLPLCAKSATALDAALDDFEKRKDVKGVTVLPDGAEKIAKAIAPKLDQLADKRKLADDAAREVAAFRASDDWAPIAQTVLAISKDSYRAFATQHDVVIKECTPLAKGKDHPRVVLVVKALKDLQGARLDGLDGIVDEYKSFSEAVNGLRKIYEQDVKAVLIESCQLDEDDRGKLDSAPVQNLLQKIRSNLLTRVGKLDDEADALARAITKLEPTLTKDSPEAKQLAKVKKALESTRASLAKAVAASPMAAGANHPWIKARMELGKSMHDRYQESMCDASEVAIGSKFIDCIQKCQIVEIKPDSKRAISRGKTQVTGYHKAVVDRWKQLVASHKGDLAKATAEFGKGFPTLVADKCIVNGELKLEAPVVETYKICPSSAGELKIGEPYFVDPAKL